MLSDKPEITEERLPGQEKSSNLTKKYPKWQKHYII